MILFCRASIYMTNRMAEEFGTPVANIDELFSQLGGCGRFQLIVTFFTSCVKAVAGMSMLLMVFGNYDPGWQCMDNSTTPNLNDLVMAAYEKTNLSETVDKCDQHGRCNDVRFSIGISTVVTEWGLVCDRSWILSLIISIQMVGVLAGAYLSGFFGDKFGRKRAIYTSTVYHAVVNIIAIFSNSWQMFAVMRFFIGVGISLMLYPPNVLAMEFVPGRWRNVIVCFPTWSIGALFFAMAALVTESWRYLHGVIAVASVIVLLPCYWMPESLRWLVVKGRVEDALSIVKRMDTLNGKRSCNSSCHLQQLSTQYRKQTNSSYCLWTSLLRKGMQYATFVIGVMSLFMMVIYYAITFSVKSLSGNFYVNLFIMFSSEIPLTAISSILPNYIGRKISIILFAVLSTTCLFMIVGFDLATSGVLRNTGTLINALLARVFVDASWDIMLTYVGELYPTFIRSSSIAYANWTARVGGILAPYLIPDDPESLYVNYLIMAVCAFICCSLLIFMPETKGKPLRETWEISMPTDSEKLRSKEPNPSSQSAL